MTSKRLFLRGMADDMRHKVWMLALSVLGSFLSMPVLWLLRYRDVSVGSITMSLSAMAPERAAEAIQESINSMADFYRQEMMLSTGIIAILGALIVGVECFHYLQQKSMVDTWHSLPVSRLQLFGLKYINGVLIWLVPYLVSMVLTLLFSGVLLARINALSGMTRLIREAGINTAILILVFLLVYHLMLLSATLTGNSLNTLALAVILGCGAVAAYMMWLIFMVTYFETYRPTGEGSYAVLGCSPLIMPFFLLYCRVEDEFMVPGFPVSSILLCIAAALAMGALALFFYIRRPSERAGRGVDIKWLAAILRVFVGSLAGMGGWMFMHLLTGGVAWSIFGMMLGGGLVYGVSDVVFSMDFKAFFRHKWSMACSLFLVLLIGVGFREDWMGYDSYLPPQDSIEKISIACQSYGYGLGSEQILEDMELTDKAQIYAFLERGIENVFGRAHKPERQAIVDAYLGGDRYRRDTFLARVTLSGGRSYCRVYPYYEWDEDVVTPLLCSEEYARAAYYLPEDVIDACVSMHISSGINNGGGLRNVEIKDESIMRKVAESYNMDLLDDPEGIIRGQDRLLGQIVVRTQAWNRSVTLDLFEGMTHTLETLDNSGIRIFDLPRKAEEVESITFEVDRERYLYGGEEPIRPVEWSIRGWFGVYPDSMPGRAEEEPRTGTDSPSSAAEYAALSESDVSEDDYRFTVTDPEKIEELLGLVQYTHMRHAVGVFTQDFVSDVTIRDSEGVEWEVYLRRGALPEEYVQRFIREAESNR